MSAKPRLLDHRSVSLVVEELHSSGVRGRQLYEVIVRAAHVDLDILDEVLASRISGQQRAHSVG